MAAPELVHETPLRAEDQGVVLFGQGHHSGGGGHEVRGLQKLLSGLRVDHDPSLRVLRPDPLQLLEDHVVVDVAVTFPRDDVVPPRLLLHVGGEIPVGDEDDGSFPGNGLHHLPGGPA